MAAILFSGVEASRGVMGDRESPHEDDAVPPADELVEWVNERPEEKSTSELLGVPGELVPGREFLRYFLLILISSVAGLHYGISFERAVGAAVSGEAAMAIGVGLLFIAVVIASVFYFYRPLVD